MPETNLSPNDLDLTVACPHTARGVCGAHPGQPCRGLPLGVVHFGRRLMRLGMGHIVEAERDRSTPGVT